MLEASKHAIHTFFEEANTLEKELLSMRCTVSVPSSNTVGGEAVSRDLAIVKRSIRALLDRGKKEVYLCRKLSYEVDVCRAAEVLRAPLAIPQTFEVTVTVPLANAKETYILCDGDTCLVLKMILADRRRCRESDLNVHKSSRITGVSREPLKEDAILESGSYVIREPSHTYEPVSYAGANICEAASRMRVRLTMALHRDDIDAVIRDAMQDLSVDDAVAAYLRRTARSMQGTRVEILKKKHQYMKELYQDLHGKLSQMLSDIEHESHSLQTDQEACNGADQEKSAEYERKVITVQSRGTENTSKRLLVKPELLSSFSFSFFLVMESWSVLSA